MRARLGVIRYLLGRPLVYGLEQGAEAGLELVSDVPGRIAECVLAGELDAGLVPVVEVLRAPDLHVVRGPCVACEGEVESIRLYHRCSLREVRRVALDTSSRTSVLLAQVILRDRYECAPECVSAPPDLSAMLETAEAALLIGDPALFGPRDLPYVDLGAEWLGLTGLPFVFALWAMRQADVALAGILQQAWRTGKLAAREIAAREAEARGVDAAWLAGYLTRSIRYDFDDRAEAGLREFIRRAQRHGLLDTGGRWLSLVG